MTTHDRTVLITGATAGIGRAAALELARRGWRVVLLARSAERAERVRREIVGAGGRAEVVLADLASLAEVRRAAAEVRERFPRLDALVNNAGIYTRARTESADGIELQFAVNHLAPFLLTHALLPVLRAGAPSRVVTVSSEAHQAARMDWDDPTGERRYNGLRAYAQSKLANLLFTAELARRTAGTGVTANAVHPGVVATELLFGGFSPLRLLKPLMRTVEKGAETLVHLVDSPEIAGITGEYFKDRRPIRRSRAARDPEAARRLWALSERMTGLADGGG